MILFKKYILFLVVLLTFNCFAIDDFAHTLDLAKYSVCKDVAEELQKTPLLTKVAHPEYSLGEECPLGSKTRRGGRGGSPQSKLKALSTGLFPWRFEITNGYQEGFVYYALKGIALENKGDIIAAYNAYQRSLVCIDENVSFAYRNPQHEVELAIGRIYLKCGRYYDAYNIFDIVRLESHDKNIKIMADAGLIDRAIAIGDYKEACEMYEDLGTFTTLSREQFNGYAKTLFSLGKDRDAFAQLLYGIAKYGFDEDLGIKDPMVDLFLNALPRTTDDEIEWYYDLVGYGIMAARAQKGDEKHIAMLLKTRMLFSTVFPFLKPEDDMKRIEKRIEYIKTNVIYQASVRYIEKTKDFGQLIFRQNKREIKTTKLSTNLLETLSYEMQLENLLMNGYICLRTTRTWKEAYKHYSRFAELCTNANMKAVYYDDTTFEAFYDFIPCITSACGFAFSPDSTKIAEVLDRVTNANCDFSKNLSFIKVVLISTLSFHPIAESTFEYVREELDNIPEKLKSIYLTQEILKNIKNKDFEKALEISDYTFKYSYYIKSPDLYYNAALLNIAYGNTEETFKIAMNGLLYFDPFMMLSNFHPKDNFWYREFCRNISSYASDDDLLKFNRIQFISEVKSFLLYYNTKDSGQKLKTAFDFQKNIFPNEIELREYWKAQDYQSAINIITNQLKNNQQPAHSLKLAEYYRQLGDLDAAYALKIEAYELKRDLLSALSSHDIYYPTMEDKYIENMNINDNQELLKKHFEWLQKREESFKEENRIEYANKIKEKLNSKPFNKLIN